MSVSDALRVMRLEKAVSDLTTRVDLISAAIGDVTSFVSMETKIADLWERMRLHDQDLRQLKRRAD